MSYDLFKCEICGGQVSRRKSFSLKELGGGNGRACRHHPEVVELIKKLGEETLKRDVAGFIRNFQVQALVAGIRVLYTLYGIWPETIFSYMRHRRVEPQMIQATRDELVRAGSWRMNTEEILSAVFAWKTVSSRRA